MTSTHPSPLHLFTCTVFFAFCPLVNPLIEDYYNYNNNYYNNYNNNNYDEDRGLFPTLINLATKSTITSNATCGEEGPEVFCKLVEHVLTSPLLYREPQCGVCDSSSADPKKRHDIKNAINGRPDWWQSPTLQNGKKFEWATINIDLGQVFQVAYVVVKAANSPRPGNWILERSLDGITYKPWQYYAISDIECKDVYGITPTVGIPRYMSDDEVICTSYYSKLNPVENGEIHTSLVNGRPGANASSEILQEFTTARHVRLRLQRIRTLHADLMTLSNSDSRSQSHKSVTRRYFYSIKDISIGGQCVCFGHAPDCPADPLTGRMECRCVHNTCGVNCEYCCPLFNQKPWRHGTTTQAGFCEKCECFGHAEECTYSLEVDQRRQSLNIEGKYEGGGVCKDCKDYTTGINCERCVDGYYRPIGVPRDAAKPCVKCQCTGPGTTGQCVQDDTQSIDNIIPGDCVCRQGFTGPKCDKCARGFRSYPTCKPCPCNFAGTYQMECEEENCYCKKNVEGRRCDMCKPGHYNLDEKNSDGCTPCFCFGVTQHCDVNPNMVAEAVIFNRGWLVSDIGSKRIFRPTEEKGIFTIANDDMLGLEIYFWLAPKDYLGNKLNAFGTKLTYSVSWVKARGDSAGRHTHGPDIIIEASGIMIAANAKSTQTAYGTEDFIKEIPLVEREWYHLSPDGLSKAKRGKKGWVGPVLSHEEFMKALHNIDRLLIRAKYHTDQIEGSLLSVGMEVASSSGIGIRSINTIERCHCPTGYDGLSCELCLEGYRRVNDTVFGGECWRCGCNNHAKSCDSFTGECHTCQHYTQGANCELCIPGFYGNPLLGTPLDCRKCACPLEDPRNNFSPTCLLKSNLSPFDYVCDQCPEGFAGDKCERCAENYFGNPMAPGNFCQPCDCSGNIDLSARGNCDSLSGQCLKCIANTDGWNCNECKDGFYGNAYHRDCRKCECNMFGSLNSICDKSDGHCFCKHNYVGRNCDRCAEGYGGITEGCHPCNCNVIGSASQRCEAVSAQCECKIGVFGAKCDSCIDGYYGFSVSGCSWCDCDTHGSSDSMCDLVNGQCPCKQFVRGRTCNQCQIGYWNILSGEGCEECGCDPIGSTQTDCASLTGQCSCKPGIAGRNCSQCLPGYFGFSSLGCRQCKPCDAPGHLCHPLTGDCVCPPNTAGASCERCKPLAWGYDPLKGCKMCECNANGSLRLQCDTVMGKCTCQDGYEGNKCDRCRFGYYDFPNCKKCSCHEEGTRSEKCVSLGVCECDNIGQCPCKENVKGKKCKKCKDATFGLLASNSKGCYECFCFNKTNKCDQSYFVWDQISSVHEQRVFTKYGYTSLNQTNGLYVLPLDPDPVTIGLQHVLSTPLYWQLPEIFLGDKVLSYNGRLSFTVVVNSGDRLFPSVLNSYPVVQLKGNFRIILEYYTDFIPPDGRYIVQLHEDLWKLKNNPEMSVTRSTMMVALQNLQYIFVRGTDSISFHSARLFDVTMDSAIAPIKASPTAAMGVEECVCPVEYTGTSCQDPAEGYYRKRLPNFLDSKDILDLVGIAVPCECNGRSRICDRETGYCFNCSENTTGPYCNLCAQGFYGDPAVSPCLPCACPTVENSFSDTCMLDVFTGYVCTHCQQGYTGRHCESCDHGYYGNPLLPDGKCIPCNCDVRGSVSTACDADTGQCFCRAGIVGKDCSQCAPRHVITHYGCQSCDDGCVGRLLDEVEELIFILESTNLTGVSAAPWRQMFAIDNQTNYLKERVDEYFNLNSQTQQLLDRFNMLDLDGQINLLLMRAIEMATKTVVETVNNATNTVIIAEELLAKMSKLEKIITELINDLNNFGKGTSSSSANLQNILDEAENLLKLIKQRNFRPERVSAENELQKAKALLDRIKLLIFNNSEIMKLSDRLNKLRANADEISAIINDKVYPTIQNTSTLQRQNKIALDKLNSSIAKINDLTMEIERLKEESGYLLNEAKTHNIEANYAITEIKDALQQLITATNDLERRNKVHDRIAEYEEIYVQPATLHAKKLRALAKEIEDLFAPTKEISARPLEAIQVYEDMLEALKRAEEAAKNASDTALRVYAVIHPTNEQSLVLKAYEAKEISLDLVQAASDIEQEKLNKLKEGIAKNVKLLELVESLHRNTTQELKGVKRKMATLHSEVGDKVKETNNRTRMAESRINATNAKVDDIKRRIVSELKNKTNDLLLAGTTAGLNSLTKFVEKAQNNITKSKDKVEKLKRKVADLISLNASMTRNLRELQEKILLARQRANGLTPSLTVNNQTGECVRSYKPEVEPSTTSHIELSYSISTPERDAFLFYLANSNLVDFMAIEMIDRKIWFHWNAGGGEESIHHDLQLETNVQHHKLDERWYRIKVVRVNNIATLSVQAIQDAHLDDLQKVTKKSRPEYLRMDVNSSSHLFIGGPPEDKRVLSAIKTKNFAGCLYEVLIDGKRLGLWNFLTNKGCDACKEGAMESKAETGEFFFQGNGYAVLPQVRRYTRNKFVVQFAFKTYDENALLFFTSNVTNNTFLSIELKRGKVVLQCRVGDSATIKLTSTSQHNSGNWVKLAASVEGSAASLDVDGDFQTDSSPTEVENPSLNLQECDLYFGGIPPNFTMTNWTSVGFEGLRGCMLGVQIYTLGLNLFAGRVYELEDGCKNTSIKIAWLKGNGYIELNGQTLERETNFAFSFQTKQNDTLLMMSTFADKANDPTDYYSVSLANQGRIYCRINAGDEPREISTADSFNDGEFHTVAVIKTARRIELRVDDESIKIAKLPSGPGALEVESPAVGGLYFGGVPPELKSKVKNYTASVEPMVGHIKDVVFNNSLLAFDNPVKFVNVGIGRFNPSGLDVPAEPEVPDFKMMKHPTKCTHLSQFTEEKSAMKFGDKPNSYVQLSTKRTALGKINITFEFNTFYPNGMLMLIKNGGQKVKHYFVVTLKNGKVVLTIQSKTQSSLVAGEKLNTGEWIRVFIRKQGQKISLAVGDFQKSEIEISTKIKLQPTLFIGGIPESLKIPENISTENFKGCIRTFYLSNKLVDLARGNMNNVTRCFTNVEAGAFFAGDAYAVYNDKFTVRQALEIELDFKTTRLNGILLSVSEDGGSPSLALEIQDGNVTATVDIGDRQPFVATVNFPTQFYVCDNKWHHIKLVHRGYSVHIYVDSKYEKFGSRVDAEVKDMSTKGPFYIGGLPDSAQQGVLATRSNFVGCIRNYIIEGERFDWTDMASRNNVLLNSCPMANE